MTKVRVSAVSYINSKPFVYGLTHSTILSDIDLSLDTPSDCAIKLIENKVDIGLVPVAALVNIPNYSIISNYCIGSNGAVDSVFIFSEKPINEIKTLRLDTESRTSNALARILLKHYWKHNVQLSNSENADAYVEIGDRTFGKKKTIPFVYDLAEQWQFFTGLPFTFAVWAANKTLNTAFITRFDNALEFGLQNRHKIIAELPKNLGIDLEDYLLNKIDYQFTTAKREALAKFLEYMKTLDTETI